MDKDNISVILDEVQTPHVSWSIPLVSYSFDEAEQLNKDLVSILDELEVFYKTTKAGEKTPDGGTSTDSVLTSKFRQYNILDRTEYESIAKFKKFAAEAFRHYIENFTPYEAKDIWVQCWGNKIGKYDFLSKHTHSHTLDGIVIAAHYSIKTPGHKTYTRYHHPVDKGSHPIPLENKPGTLNLFPSFVPHETSPNRSATEFRYTLGIDVFHNPNDVTLGHTCLVKLL